MEVRKHPIGNKRRIDWGKWKITLSIFVVIILAYGGWFFINKPARDQGLLLIPSGCKKPTIAVAKLSDGENSAIQFWAKEQERHFWAFRVEPFGKPVPLTRGQESVDVQVHWRPRMEYLQSEQRDCTLVLQQYRDRTWRVVNGSPGNACYWTNP
jgi:hypothetical protein